MPSSSPPAAHWEPCTTQLRALSLLSQTKKHCTSSEQERRQSREPQPKRCITLKTQLRLKTWRPVTESSTGNSAVSPQSTSPRVDQIFPHSKGRNNHQTLQLHRYSFAKYRGRHCSDAGSWRAIGSTHWHARHKPRPLPQYPLEEVLFLPQHTADHSTQLHSLRPEPGAAKPPATQQTQRTAFTNALLYRTPYPQKESSKTGRRGRNKLWHWDHLRRIAGEGHACSPSPSQIAYAHALGNKLRHSRLVGSCHLLQKAANASSDCCLSVQQHNRKRQCQMTPWLSCCPYHCSLSTLQRLVACSPSTTLTLHTKE